MIVPTVSLGPVTIRKMLWLTFYEGFLGVFRNLLFPIYESALVWVSLQQQNISFVEILMKHLSNIKFSVISVSLKKQKMILVWFGQWLSLKVDVQTFWEVAFEDASRRLPANSRLYPVQKIIQ